MACILHYGLHSKDKCFEKADIVRNDRNQNVRLEWDEFRSEKQMTLNILIFNCIHKIEDKHCSQYVEAGLNKRSCSGLKKTTAWKSIPCRFKIIIFWNPRKSGMYYEFSKNDILLMQQLKVLVVSSVETILWNVLFSRILIYGYLFWIMLWYSLGLSMMFKSASSYCGPAGSQ